MALASSAGCGDDDSCAPVVDAGATATLVSVDGESFDYGQFEALAGGDCGPDRRGISIAGKQAVTNFPITLCLPDPDGIGADPIPLGDARIKLEDVQAKGASCSYVWDAAGTPTGTITFGGFCTKEGMGFTMTFAGSVPGTSSCASDAGPPTGGPVVLQLSGSVDVKVVGGF